MSLKNREKAIDIISTIIGWKVIPDNDNVSDKLLANHILNKLLKAGFLNDETSVHASEIREELGQAAFKCKVEE